MIISCRLNSGTNRSWDNESWLSAAALEISPFILAQKFQLVSDGFFQRRVYSFRNSDRVSQPTLLMVVYFAQLGAPKILFLQVCSSWNHSHLKQHWRLNSFQSWTYWRLLKYSYLYKYYLYGGPFLWDKFRNFILPCQCKDIRCRLSPAIYSSLY